MSASILTGWTVVTPGLRTSYRTLTRAYLASIRHRSPVLRDGRVVTITADRVDGRVALTGWWLQ